MEATALEEMQARKECLEGRSSPLGAAERIELEGLKEILSWLENLELRLGTEANTGLFNSLVQLGVEDPRACTCEDSLREPALIWLHAHHVQYNQAVWEILNSGPGVIQPLRRVTQRDLDGPDHFHNGPSAYGKLVLKSYGQALLDHFLKTGPTPSWVS